MSAAVNFLDSSCLGSDCPWQHPSNYDLRHPDYLGGKLVPYREWGYGGGRLGERTGNWSKRSQGREDRYHIKKLGLEVRKGWS